MEVASRLFERVFHASGTSSSNTTATNATEDNADAVTTTENSILRAEIAHLSAFGIPGRRDPSTPRAKVSDWYSCGFRKPKSIPWSMDVTQDHIEKLIRGFAPRKLEEKWFIYSEDVYEDERVSRLKVSMSLTWEGDRIFELDVAFSDETDASGVPVSAKIVALTYETQKKIVDSADDDWAKSQAQEICSWVLGVALE